MTEAAPKFYILPPHREIQKSSCFSLWEDSLAQSKTQNNYMAAQSCHWIMEFVSEGQCQGRWHPRNYDTYFQHLHQQLNAVSKASTLLNLLSIKYFQIFKQSPISFCFHVNFFGQEDPKPSCFCLTGYPISCVCSFPLSPYLPAWIVLIQVARVLPFLL